MREELARLAPKVELLENLRFDPGEEHNDPAFVEKLVNTHDVYVNDAFGVSHRRHASVVGPPARLPSAAGFLLERELEGLGTLLGSPDRPFVAVVGGAKVADKLGVLESLLERVDALLVGGGMAFTFLAATGHSVGDSLVDTDRIDECARLLRSTDKVHPSLRPGGARTRCARSGATAWKGRSVDRRRRTFPRSGKDSTSAPRRSPTTRGRSRVPARCSGTDRWGCSRTSGSAPGRRHRPGGGGSPRLHRRRRGDSVAAVDELGLTDRVSFISTGGGATLELLEHGDLPGLAALRGAGNAPEPDRVVGRRGPEVVVRAVSDHRSAAGHWSAATGR